MCQCNFYPVLVVEATAMYTVCSRIFLLCTLAMWSMSTYITVMTSRGMMKVTNPTSRQYHLLPMLYEHWEGSKVFWTWPSEVFQPKKIGRKEFPIEMIHMHTRQSAMRGLVTTKRYSIAYLMASLRSIVMNSRCNTDAEHNMTSRLT